MKLIDNAGEVLKKAWSLRLMGLSILLMAADQALPYFAPEQPSRAFGILSAAVGIAAMIARLVQQNGLTPPSDGRK